MQLRPRLFLLIILLVQTIYCWYCMVKAKYLAYDENYGLLIQAIIIAFAMWVVLRMIYAWKRNWIPGNKLVFIVWLIAGSPIPFIVASIFYSDIFGPLAT